ncbi:MAG: YHYH protein [Bacteroidia bacterium]|nr:YHYH protein [Bacteroidia bacterium]
MKKISLNIVMAILGVSSAFGQTTAPEVTTWVRNTTGATGYGGLPSNVQVVQYSSSQVYVSCSCIPGYNIGPWTANPNLPTNQNLVHKISRNPTQNTGAAIYTGLGSIGLWSNGVVIFNPKDGYFWNNTASTFSQGVTTTGWNRNAKYYEGISFDACLGHPAPNGAYHNHVNPTCLYSTSNTAVHSPIIGYAFDGYPVYGAYAYTGTNGTGAIKRMTPSYQLAAATGSVLTGANGATPASSSTASTTRLSGPPVNSTYPLGSMCEDYIYIPGSGDLDDHNGRFCITPEYPVAPMPTL